MDALKKTAIGVLPTISEEPRDESLKTTKDMFLGDLEDKLQRKKNSLAKRVESYERWAEEKEKSFQIKTNPLLMRVAMQVNMSLNPEEEVVLNALENELGRKIDLSLS